MISVKELSARFARLSAAIVSDVLRIAGATHQVLHHSVKPITLGHTLAGPAFCVKGERILGGAPKRTGPSPRHEMFRRAGPGTIIVVESGGYEDCVVFGENVALAFRIAGSQGIVTDGGIRDYDAMANLGIPVFSRFTTPLSSGGQWAMTELEVPLRLAGQSSASVTVHPGDILLGDSDGVVVVPRHAAESVLEDSERLAEIEKQVHEGLMSGRDPGEVFESVNRFGHIRRIDGLCID